MHRSLSLTIPGLLVVAALAAACGSSSSGSVPTSSAGCVKLWNEKASASMRAAARPPASSLSLQIGDARSAITPEGQAISTIRSQAEGGKHACWIDLTYPAGWDGLPVTDTYSATSTHGFRHLPAIGGLGASLTADPVLHDPEIAWNRDGTIRLTGGRPAPHDRFADALRTLAAIPPATADSLSACATQHAAGSDSHANCVSATATLAARATSTAASAANPPGSVSTTCLNIIADGLPGQVTTWTDTLNRVATLPSYVSEVQSSAPNAALGFATFAADCGIATANANSPSSTSGNSGAQGGSSTSQGGTSTGGGSTSSGSGQSAVDWAGFQTPSHNIVCNLGSLGSGVLNCQVFSAGPTNWTLHAHGAVKLVQPPGQIGTEVPSLGYGRRWARDGLTCNSEENGLTCRNSDGHGFYLSRGSQRVF